MFRKLSVLIPTRCRLERLDVLLRSYEETQSGCSELVFRIDEDDMPSNAHLVGRRCVIGPRRGGYASMSSFFNDMLPQADGDVLMIGNDDMIFRTPGWDWRILEAANHYPDGLFNFGVKTFNEDHYPFAIFSRKAAETLGFAWDPRIYWGDIFWRDVMGTLERLFKLPAVEIEHDWAGHAPDQTFLEEDQNRIYSLDPTYWAGTHRTCVDEAVAKLKELKQ